MDTLLTEEKREHKRIITKQARDRFYAYRYNNKLCIYCGKSPALVGLNSCKKCRIRVNLSARERRRKKTSKAIDNLIDNNLIPTPEACQILGVQKTALYAYVRAGKLEIQSKRALTTTRTFWFKEEDIYDLLRKKIPNMKCLSCGHIWHTDCKSPKHCPRSYCRSAKIIRLNKRFDKRHPFVPFKTSLTKLTKEQIEQMIEDKKNNQPVVSICTKYDICMATLYKYWRKYSKQKQLV